MATRRTNGPVWAVVAAVTAVAVVGALAWAFTADRSSAPAPGDRTVLVVVDGWSWQMRADRDLEVRVDDATVDATFEPVDDATVDELLADDPAAVTALLARQLVADPSLACNEQGCSTSSGDVDPRQLVDPDDPVLDAQGVTAGAYVARVPADSTSEVSVVLGQARAALEPAPELAEPTVVDTPAGALLPVPQPAPAPPESQSGPPLEPGSMDDLLAELERRQAGPLPPGPDPGSPVPGNGVDGLTGNTAPPVQPLASGPLSVGQGDEPTTQTRPDPTVFEVPADATPDPSRSQVLAVGVAWGQVFTLSVPWYAGPSDPPAATAFGAPRTDVEPATSTDVTPAPFRAGLASDDPAAAFLTPSQLTMWSSPSVGCGPAVVCAATAEGVQAPAGDPDVHSLCLVLVDNLLQSSPSAAGPDRVGRSEVPVTVVLRSSTYTFDATERRQLGNWPLDTPVPGNSLWPVPVPATNRDVELAVRSVEVHDGLGLLTLLGSQAPVLDGPFDVATAIEESGGLLAPCSAATP